MDNICKSNCDQCVININGQVVNDTGKILMKMLIADLQDGYG